MRTLCIDEYIASLPDYDLFTENSTTRTDQEALTDEDIPALDDGETDIIRAGHRHSTLKDYGIKYAANYGITKAKDKFYKKAEQCEPPLPVSEINSLWEWIESRAKEFKARYTKKGEALTVRAFEQTLNSFNISVRWNVITKELDISDLPSDCEHVPEGYENMNAAAKRQANVSLLPLFLESHFRKNACRFSKNFITDSINATAITNEVNPVRDMLTSTKWDGQDRLSKLCEVLGIQDNGFHCSFLRKWLHQAISLALNDEGDLFADFVLVLQGAQGAGKTNFFRRLAVKPEWYREGAVIDTSSAGKDTIIQATNVWICELGELDSTLKKEQASLKSFLTATHDTYRRPYSRTYENIERRTCFCATVNPEQVLRDETGSRRYVIIHIDAIDKDFLFEGMTQEWITQLWRQVYEELYQGLGRKRYRLDDEEKAYSERQNSRTYSVALDAEIELLDAFYWQSSNYPEWECRRIKTITALCPSLAHIKPRKIGDAIRCILKKLGLPEKDFCKHTKFGAEFRTPPVRTLTDEERKIESAKLWR